MLRVLFLISILFVSFFSVRAGVPPVPSPTSAVPLDSIGKSSDKDLIVRFEVLKIELKKDTTTKAYIITYGTKSQIRRRERQIRKALAFHKIDLKRVMIFRNSADSDDFVTNIYIVPESKVPPKP